MSEPTTDFLVGKREGSKRLDHFLHERIPGLSRTRIQQAIRERVTLSWGVEPRCSTRVRAGGVVHIGYTPIEEEPLELEIPILTRGVGWLAVDKPAGIAVHPVNRERDNTLIRMLRRQLDDESLRLVHRLDRETSGVLIVAEDGPTAGLFAPLFAGRAVRKEYLAWVSGSPASEAGEIRFPVGDRPESRVYVKRYAGVGQPAHTRWRVERRLGDRTLLRVELLSGRRHQIRVHLDAIGHPVLGDLLYGRDDVDYLRLVAEGVDARIAEGGPLRQLLHCARLTFEAPGEAQPRVVEAPLPSDFAL